MYSYRWAKFLVAGAKYNDSHFLLVEFYIHHELDASLNQAFAETDNGY